MQRNDEPEQSAKSDELDVGDVQAQLDEIYNECHEDYEQGKFSYRTTYSYLDLLDEDASDANLIRAMELLQLGINYHLERIYNVDHSDRRENGRSFRRQDAYDGLVSCTKLATRIYNRRPELDHHDFRLTAAVSLSRKLVFEYRNKREIDPATHKSTPIILQLISGIVPNSDRQRYFLAYCHNALRAVYRVRLDLKTMFEHAYKSLELYADIEDKSGIILHAISELFDRLKDSFEFDHDLQQLFLFASNAFKLGDDSAKLETLAGLIWKYNNDFSGISADKQKAFMFVLDLIMRCIKAGKFAHNSEGERISDFPRNAFREEMDMRQKLFMEIHASATNNHIDFKRIGNQPQLVFQLFAYSKQLEAKLATLEQRVIKLDGAQHARLFKRSRLESDNVDALHVLDEAAANMKKSDDTPPHADESPAKKASL